MSEQNDVDVLQVIASRGSKGLIDVLRQQGFVDESTVNARIEERAQILTAQNEIKSAYSELNDPNSDFFRVATANLKELVGAGVPRATALKLAAQRAELDEFKSGKRLTPAQKEERARSEKPASKNTEPDEDLTDFQKTICDRMGISYDKYKANAKGPAIPK